jgi:hypothetical protein
MPTVVITGLVTLVRQYENGAKTVFLLRNRQGHFFVVYLGEPGIAKGDQVLVQANVYSWCVKGFATARSCAQLVRVTGNDAAPKP